MVFRQLRLTVPSNYPARLRQVIGYLVLLVFVPSCSQESNGVVSKTYHNITAYYNAYYLARERLETIEDKVFADRKDDYNQILDIILPVDSVLAAGLAKETEYCVQKSSIAIQRHKNSKWVDDSYLVLARTRYYQYDFPKAIETYKYVNSNSNDRIARQRALIGIFNTYRQAGDYNSARAVINFIKRERLTKKNLAEFYLIRAQLHKEQEEYAQAAGTLALAAPLMKKGERKARVHFIRGQLYQLLNNPKEAYKNFRATLRNNPSFELGFQAKLHTIQFYQAKGSNSDKRVQARFRKLLRDRKNADTKDKIYYHMALYEYKRGSKEKAVAYLRESAKYGTTDVTQKAYTFLKLGQIYFDDLQQYELAKAYYDSTVQVLPPTARDYEAIAKRQKVLGDFVQHQVTIQTEDSLQRLAKMDSVSLNKLLDEQIAKEMEAQRAQEEKARRLERASNDAENAFAAFDTTSNANVPGNAGNSGGGNANTANNASGGGGQFYFSNTALVSRGRTAFARKWGNRRLEDNWRRASKETLAEMENTDVAPVSADTDTAGANTPADPADIARMRKESMIAALPRTPEAIKESDFRLEEAHFQLGKIYNFELEEPEQAAKTFEQLLTRFPESDHLAEVYYLMYLIHKNLAQAEVQDEYKNKLVSQFPGSTYAKLVANANYVRDENLNDRRIRDAYTAAYERYKMGNYDEARQMADEALQSKPVAHLEERFQLLKILITGRTQDADTFKKALTTFMEQYPQSELIPYAQTILNNGNGEAKKPERSQN